MHFIKLICRLYIISLLHFNLSIFFEKVKFGGFYISYSKYSEDLLINEFLKLKKRDSMLM